MKSSPPSGSSRLIALLSVFAIIPLVLLVALPLKMATTSLGKEATARVADTGAVSANAISMQMASISGLTQSFGSRPELVAKTSIPVTSPKNPTVEILAQLRQSNPAVRSSFVLDAQGKYIVGEGTKGAPPGTDFSYRDYYKGAVASSSPYIAGAIIGSVEPHPKVVTASRAIRGEADIKGQQPLLAVLVVAVDVSKTFQAYVDEFKAQSGVSSTIVDQQGGIVARPGLGLTVPTTADGRIDDARRGVSSSAKFKQNNEKVIVAYTPIKNTAWVMSTSVPESAAFAPIEQFRARVFIIAMILGTVILAAFRLTFSIIASPRKSGQQHAPQ